jgi:hypothetical protein
MARKSEYFKCSFLIPVRGETALSDGSSHAPHQWNWLRSELWDRFQGATESPGMYVGFYQDPDTKSIVHDESRRFTVAVPRKDMTRFGN